VRSRPHLAKRIDRPSIKIRSLDEFGLREQDSRQECCAPVLLENLNKMYGSVSITGDHRLTILRRLRGGITRHKKMTEQRRILINQTTRARCDIIVGRPLITVSRKCE
jgi:hypothetical protein